MNVQIQKLYPAAIIPTYQTSGAAAADVHACLDEPMQINPGERVVVPTGLAMAIPVGYEVQIRARSGMSLKHGITLANGVGTIDSDYRGEVGVLLANISDTSFTIEPGMRVAQMVLARHEVLEWSESDSLDDTERGSNGFGSTGVREKR